MPARGVSYVIRFRTAATPATTMTPASETLDSRSAVRDAPPGRCLQRRIGSSDEGHRAILGRPRARLDTAADVAATVREPLHVRVARRLTVARRRIAITAGADAGADELGRY